MNLRNILRAYSMLRQLSDDETALLEALRELTDSDREQLIESLAPAKPTARKRKPRVARSPRAESLATAIQGTVGKPHLGDGPVCTICSHTEDYEDHAQPSPHYHEFQPPKPVMVTTGVGG